MSDDFQVVITPTEKAVIGENDKVIKSSVTGPDSKPKIQREDSKNGDLTLEEIDGTKSKEIANFSLFSSVPKSEVEASTVSTAVRSASSSRSAPLTNTVSASSTPTSSQKSWLRVKRFAKSFAELFKASKRKAKQANMTDEEYRATSTILAHQNANDISESFDKDNNDPLGLNDCLDILTEEELHALGQASPDDINRNIAEEIKREQEIENEKQKAHRMKKKKLPTSPVRSPKRRKSALWSEREGLGMLSRSNTSRATVFGNSPKAQDQDMMLKAKKMAAPPGYDVSIDPDTGCYLFTHPVVGSWLEYMDGDSKSTYFYDPLTGDYTWELPCISHSTGEPGREDVALIIMNMQEDFLYGGALGTLDDLETKKIGDDIAKIRDEHNFRVTIHCICTRSKNHCTFSSNNPGKNFKEEIRIDDTTHHTVPDYCVEGTNGVRISGVEIRGTDAVVTYGTDNASDSYDPFYKNKYLEELLTLNGINIVLLVGVGLEFSLPTILAMRKSSKTAHIKQYVYKGLIPIGYINDKSEAVVERLHREGVPEVGMEMVNSIFYGDLTHDDLHRVRSSLPEDPKFLQHLFKNEVNKATRTLYERQDATTIVNQISRENGKSAIHVCCETNEMTFLKELGNYSLDYNKRSLGGDLPLISAVKFSRYEAAKYILEAGKRNKKNAVDVNGRDALGRTALMWATINRCMSCVQLLMKHGAEIDVMDMYKKSALFYASCNDGNQNVSKEILWELAPSLRGDEFVKNKKKMKALLTATDRLGFSCIHAASRSGMLPMFNLVEFRLSCINKKTKSGYGAIHLAAWNGSFASLEYLFMTTWRPTLHYNKPTNGSDYTPLDLALSAREHTCVRLMLENSCHSIAHANAKPNPLEPLLHQLVLSGEYASAQGLLQFDESNVTVDDNLLKLTKLCKRPCACTFSFTGYGEAPKQFLYLVTDKNSASYGKRVCAVCKAQCHPPRDHAHILRKEDFVYIKGYCECNKTECVSLDLKAAELAGYKYKPSPINTSVLDHSKDFMDHDSKMMRLAKMMAREFHRSKCKDLVRLGWQYSPTEDKSRRLSKFLLPFNRLDKHDQQIRTNEQRDKCLKVLFKLGYRIRTTQSQRDLQVADEKDADAGTTSLSAIKGTRDLSDVKLTQGKKQLSHLLAQNLHHIWSHAQILSGRTYAPARLAGYDKQFSPFVVPFALLPGSFRQKYLDIAATSLQQIMHFGFTIENAQHTTDLNKCIMELKGAMSTLKRRNVFDKMPFYNMFLRHACRLDAEPEFIRAILDSGADINIADDYFQHSPLYLAAKRGNTGVVRMLLNAKANVNCEDIHGLSPLSVCAYLGHKELCRTFVMHQADLSHKDNQGYTPLHRAAMNGYDDVCRLLSSFSKLNTTPVTKDILAHKKPEPYSSHKIYPEKNVSRMWSKNNQLKSAHENKNTRASNHHKAQNSKHHVTVDSPLLLAISACEPRAVKVLLDTRHGDPCKKGSDGITGYERALMSFWNLFQEIENNESADINRLTSSHLGKRYRSTQIIMKELNQQSSIKKLRNRFAINLFLKRSVPSIIFLAGMIICSPVVSKSGGPDMQLLYKLKSLVFTEDVNTASRGQSWYELMKGVIIEPYANDAGGIFADATNGSVKYDLRLGQFNQSFYGSGSRIFNTDIVSVGKIVIEQYRRNVVTCGSQSLPIYDQDIIPLDFSSPEYCSDNPPVTHWSLTRGPPLPGDRITLDIKDYKLREKQFNELASSQFIDDTTREVLTTMMGYDPNNLIFFHVQFKSVFEPNGLTQTYVDMNTVHGSIRFAPSPVFSLIVLLNILWLLIQQSFRTHRAIADSHSKDKKNKRQILAKETCGNVPAFGFWMQLITFVGLLALDVVSWLTLYGILNINNVNTTNIDGSMEIIMGYLEIERLIFSLVLMVAGIGVLYSFRLVPSWGNYVIAVINTIANMEVGLYVLVWVIFTIIFGIVFHSLINTRVVHYADFSLSIFRSLQASMDWAILFEDWKYSLDANYDSSRSIQLILSIFHFLWTIVAVVLINLFIGIVTLKWGSERSSSEHEWDRVITKNMAKSLKRRIKKHANSTKGKTNKWAAQMFSQKNLFLTNENDMIKSGIRSISTKLRILKGSDGHKFWKRPSQYNGQESNNGRVSQHPVPVEEYMITKFGRRKMTSTSLKKNIHDHFKLHN